MKTKPLILETVTSLIADIDKNGIDINGTKELVGKTLTLMDITQANLLEEENSIKEYYYSLGINTQVIRSLEHNLYEFIFRGLKQSIEQLFYFDKTQDYTSRRFVFSTTDCISHVQLLFRHEKAYLFMYIRSTDVKKLFPWDMLFAFNLLNRILLECRFPLTKKKYVSFTIASAHYYVNPKAMY